MSLDLNAVVKSVSITDTKGVTHPLTGNNPEAQIVGLKIFENIESYTMLAELMIFDTAINLVASAPIVGTETVEIELQAPTISETTYKWKFVVYGIRNRVVSTSKQLYVLDLFSEEALRNETLRVGKVLKGTGDAIATDLINNYVKSDKQIVDTEACKYKMKLIPSLKRPFDVITSILPECVSSSANPSVPNSATSLSGSGGTASSQNGVTNSVTATSAPVISGSAGYMFFERYDGYVFKSIDSMINASLKHKEYVYAYAQSDKDTAEKNAFKILNYSFSSQENILRKMRYGVYSSMISFFNPSSCEYEEYFFDLSKEYPQMYHLGKDESLPETIKTLSQFPTRIMLQCFDHEIFHDDDDIAAPDQGGSAEFPDFKKQWLAQSISRGIILNNQVLNITIPINFELRAGDKLKVQLPNQSVQSKREEQKYDKSNSGFYLIKKISYEIIRDDSKGLVAVCNAELIRDNLGS